jgi:hypothetical protein
VPEGDDVLDALAQRPIARLPRWERDYVRKEAKKILVERHARELQAIEDDEARRRLAQRPLF